MRSAIDFCAGLYVFLHSSVRRGGMRCLVWSATYDNRFAVGFLANIFELADDHFVHALIPPEPRMQYAYILYAFLLANCIWNACKFECILREFCTRFAYISYAFLHAFLHANCFRNSCKFTCIHACMTFTGYIRCYCATTLHDLVKLTFDLLTLRVFHVQCFSCLTHIPIFIILRLSVTEFTITEYLITFPLSETVPVHAPCHVTSNRGQK